MITFFRKELTQSKGCKTFKHMILAYNLSPTIKDTLAKIDALNNKLLLIPLSLKNEQRLKWETTIARIYWSLILSANPLSKNHMAKILVSHDNKKREGRQVINYQKALTEIKDEWLVTRRNVTLNSLLSLYKTCCKIISPQDISLKKRKELNMLFDFLNQSTEHPVIQAGISQIEMIEIAPFDDGNGRMARLMPYLYLYKNGYNCRDMLVLEEYFRRDLVGLKLAIENVTKSGNLTYWLEYFVKGFHSQLEKALAGVEDIRFTTDISSSYFKLNERQKEIIALLESPGSRITNKMVKKRFGTSQITASRDLAKLLNLEIVFVHGKGRSTYYTKA